MHACAFHDACIHAQFMMHLCNYCAYALLDEQKHTWLCSNKELCTKLITLGTFKVTNAHKCINQCMMHVMGACFCVCIDLHVEDSHFELCLKEIGSWGQKL
jgi:hypothetical protein